MLKYLDIYSLENILQQRKYVYITRYIIQDKYLLLLYYTYIQLGISTEVSNIIFKCNLPNHYFNPKFNGKFFYLLSELVSQTNQTHPSSKQFVWTNSTQPDIRSIPT